MNEINFKSFPSSRNEALAMLYLQSQDLSDKSPAQIYKMYLKTLSEIREAIKEDCERGTD